MGEWIKVRTVNDTLVALNINNIVWAETEENGDNVVSLTDGREIYITAESLKRLCDFLGIPTETEKKKSYKLAYDECSSTDISFCNAEYCRTECQRNRNLPFFKKHLEQLKKVDGFYSLADFQDCCLDYT